MSNSIITPIAVSIHPSTSNAVFGQGILHLSIDDEGGGQFFVLEEVSDIQDPGKVKIDPEEMSVLLEAARRLMPDFPFDNTQKEAPTTESKNVSDEELVQLWNADPGGVREGLRLIYELGKKHGADLSKTKDGQAHSTSIGKNEPLWVTMQRAYFLGRGSGYNEGPAYAQELRAVAHWIELRYLASPALESARDAARWLRDQAVIAEKPSPKE